MADRRRRSGRACSTPSTRSCRSAPAAGAARRHRPQPHEPLDARRQRPGPLRVPQGAFPGVDPLQVVLAYDVRQFEDQREASTTRDLPNPVLHLSSREFCQHAAGVYAANGIHAHILPPDSKRYLATPELSFTHPLPAGARRAEHVRLPQPARRQRRQVLRRARRPAGAARRPDHGRPRRSGDGDPARCRWPTRCGRGKVQFLDEAPHRAYIDLCRKQSLVPPPKIDEIRVVFTPLHGVGGFCAGGDARGAGLPADPGRGAGDAGRPVPERDEDAEPGSARVHGPGRERGPRAPRRPGARHRPRRRPHRRHGEHVARRQGRLPLHHRQRDRRAADALQAERNWREPGRCRRRRSSSRRR